jgi:hypothetical protein
MLAMRCYFVLFAICLGTTCFGQQEVTSVDFFGLRTLSQQQLEQALGLTAGVASVADIKELKRRVLELENIEDASVAPIHFPGNLALFIGVQEKGQASTRFRAAPTGDITLRAELVRDYNETMELLLPAIKNGQAGEDRSAGHAISEYEAMRDKQTQFIQVANEEFDTLAQVIRESSDADSRTAAACILAYADDKRKVIDELTIAADDADAGVRNNAVRALSILATYAYTNPDLGLVVNPKPFLQLLGSLTWTDRNKGAAVLDSLSQQRDPELLAALRATSLTEVEEMARWKSNGHCLFSIRILARLAGQSEDEIQNRAKASKNHEDRMLWVDELMEQIEQPQ